MPNYSKPNVYREFIDRLVQDCRRDQGQIGPARARKGLWNPNAREGYLEDQHEMNLLLGALSLRQRETLAAMLENAFSGGVFETLKALEEFRIEPFLDGCEGSPFEDFIGRLDGDWEWPEAGE